MSEVTRILAQIESGDPQVAEQLLPLVYDELRKLAAARLAQEKPGQTLQPTALVHEAYLRLVGDQEFASSRQFFAAAAEAMRRILIDNARRKSRQKRGGDLRRVDLDEFAVALQENDQRLIALDEALTRFALIEPDKAELVKIRWFGGMSLDTAAELLGISPSTADRWWAYARAWLRFEMEEEKSN